MIGIKKGRDRLNNLAAIDWKVAINCLVTSALDCTLRPNFTLWVYILYCATSTHYIWYAYGRAYTFFVFRPVS